MKQTNTKTILIKTLNPLSKFDYDFFGFYKLKNWNHIKSRQDLLNNELHNRLQVLHKALKWSRKMLKNAKTEKEKKVFSDHVAFDTANFKQLNEQCMKAPKTAIQFKIVNWT